MMNVSERMAKEVSCPKCKARKNQPCVYILGSVEVTWHHTGWYGPTREKIDRAGQPTKKVHNERRRKVHQKLIREWLADQQPKPPTALQALNAFDQREHEALRGWLRDNATRLGWKPV